MISEASDLKGRIDKAEDRLNANLENFENYHQLIKDMIELLSIDSRMQKQDLKDRESISLFGQKKNSQIIH
jgi:hypothetical protein